MASYSLAVRQVCPVVELCRQDMVEAADRWAEVTAGLRNWKAGLGTAPIAAVEEARRPEVVCECAAAEASDLHSLQATLA